MLLVNVLSYTSYTTEVKLLEESEVIRQMLWALGIEWEKFKRKHPDLKKCPIVLESVKHSFTIGFWSGVKIALNVDIMESPDETTRMDKKRVLEEVERGLRLTT